jgi:uncharacterized protein
VQPRIHVLTLAVDDLDRAVAFYRDGLGLETPSVVGTKFTGDDATPAGAVAMFELQGGLILALYPCAELAKDAGIPVGPPGSGEVSIGHAVADKAEVDALLARGEAPAGGSLTGQPHERPSERSRCDPAAPNSSPPVRVGPSLSISPGQRLLPVRRRPS